MKIKTKVKAGGGNPHINHSQKLKIKTRVKAGGQINHNQSTKLR